METPRDLVSWGTVVPVSPPTLFDCLMPRYAKLSLAQSADLPDTFISSLKSQGMGLYMVYLA